MVRTRTDIKLRPSNITVIDQQEQGIVSNCGQVNVDITLVNSYNKTHMQPLLSCYLAVQFVHVIMKKNGQIIIYYWLHVYFHQLSTKILVLPTTELLWQ